MNFQSVFNNITNIAIVLIILMILVFIHEMGHIRATRKHGGYVPEFAVGFFPGSKSLWKWTSPKTKTTYHLKPWPLGGYIIPADEEYQGSMHGKKHFRDFTFPQKLHVLLNGILYNLYFAAALIIPFFMITGTPSEAKLNVAVVTQNSPAQSAQSIDTQKAPNGLQSGDTIVKINNEDFNEIEFINEKKPLVTSAEPVIVTVDRNGQMLDFKISPVQENGRYLVGIQTQSEVTAVDHSLGGGIKQFGTIIKQSVQGIGNLLRLQNIDQAQSIVGTTDTIGQITGQTPELIDKIKVYVLMAGLISIGLAVFNLIPIPALDGGQILLIVIERIRGKEINKALKTKILNYSFIIVLVLGLLLIFRDVWKLIFK
jgi:regulator of sigma E protease